MSRTLKVGLCITNFVSSSPFQSPTRFLTYISYITLRPCLLHTSLGMTRISFTMSSFPPVLNYGSEPPRTSTRLNQDLTAVAAYAMPVFPLLTSTHVSCRYRETLGVGGHLHAWLGASCRTCVCMFETQSFGASCVHRHLGLTQNLRVYFRRQG